MSDESLTSKVDKIIDWLNEHDPEGMKRRWDFYHATMPTVPGNYYDNEGTPWRLDEDGHWWDTNNETRPTKFNFMLADNGPYEKAD